MTNNRGNEIKPEDPVDPPNKEESKKAIKALKHNRTPGLDEIPSGL